MTQTYIERGKKRKKEKRDRQSEREGGRHIEKETVSDWHLENSKTALSQLRVSVS